MAKFDFSNLDQLFNIENQLVTFAGKSGYLALPTAFSWNNTLSNVAFGPVGAGAQFTYTGGVPAQGTVGSFHLDLDRDNDTVAAELVVSNLSFAFNKLAPLVDGSLPDAEAENDFIWRTLLSGNDEIVFGAGLGSGYIAFAGDGRYARGTVAILGGNDVLTGNVRNGGAASGDFHAVLAGSTVFGGGDTLELQGINGFGIGDATYVPGFLGGGSDKLSVQAGGSMAVLIGDAYQVYGGGTVVGGNDRIEAQNATFAIGDAQYVSGFIAGGKPFSSNIPGGTLVGGNDIIIGSSVDGANLAGDVQQIYEGGVVRGGADVIEGGSGGEVIRGDAFRVDSGGTLFGGDDTIHGNGGGDLIYGDWQIDGSGAAVGGDDMLYGDAGVDEIHGNSGNDEIHGGADQDTMFGDAGDDTFVIDALSDIASGDNFDGGDGTDTLRLADQAGSYGVNLSLVSLSSVEALTYGKAGASGTATGGIDASQFGPGQFSSGATITGNSLAGIADTFAVAMGSLADLNLSSLKMVNFGNPTDKVTIAGGAGDNRITGTSVGDTIDGKGGADTMKGLGGNDVYVVDNAGDVVDESVAGSAGVDTVRSSTLFVHLFDSAHFKGPIEQAAVDGNLALNAVGNSVNNYLQGNGAANGINGGLGNDILRGNGGADRFHFNTTLSAATNVDFINDFAIDDTIFLHRTIFSGIATTGTLAAAAFAKNNTGAAGDASDRIVYETDSGKLFYDADGLGGVAGIHFATLPVGLALTNADFVVS